MSTLATRVGNQAALRERLRILCGYAGDVVMMPDASCDAYLDTALDRINSVDPLVGIGSFPTVDGTQVYTQLPAGGYYIRQAWWPNCNDLAWGESALGLRNWLVELDARFGQPIDDLGTRTALDPGTVSIVLRKSEQVQRWLSNGFAAVNNGTDVYLGPVPGAAVTVYFSYTKDRFASVGVVTLPYFDAFWLAAQAAALAGISIGAGAVTQVDDTQEGTSIKLNVGSSAAKRAADLELRFSRTLSILPVEGWLFG